MVTGINGCYFSTRLNTMAVWPGAHVLICCSSCLDKRQARLGSNNNIIVVHDFVSGVCWCSVPLRVCVYPRIVVCLSLFVSVTQRSHPLTHLTCRILDTSWYVLTYIGLGSQTDR